MQQQPDNEFTPGRPVTLSPRLRRMTGNNPGIMTGPGTNTYLVGHERIAVIDPGVEDEQHVKRIVELGQGRIEWIVVTHAHPDHSPASRALSRLTGAPILAHPHQLQGIRDTNFRADDHLLDNETLCTPEFTLRALHTPGHAADHLVFVLEEDAILLAGDQVMDGATVVIAPPDGDMAAYINSLRRLRELDLRAIAPAHGRLLESPQSVLDEIIAHRLAREAMVLAAVRDTGLGQIADMVKHIYTDVPEVLHPVAEGSVHAHLLKLEAEGRVRCENGHWQATDPTPGEQSA